MNIISTENLTKIYPAGAGELVVLNNLSIQIPEKSLVMLQGRSGSGKTTLINILSSLEEPTSGDIIFADKRYSEMNESDKENLRRTNMGFVFQSVALIPIMTAYENIDFGLRVAEGIPKGGVSDKDLKKQAKLEKKLEKKKNKKKNNTEDSTESVDASGTPEIIVMGEQNRTENSGQGSVIKETETDADKAVGSYVQEKDRRIREALRSVGLEERMNHVPAELSGGEQQRVAIARAFIHKPAVIFADEPTGALDTVAGINVVKLFRSLVDEYGLTIVMSTHDRGLLDMADVVFSLENGNLKDND